MGKLVFFQLRGDFATGFQVNLQITDESDRRLIANLDGELPPATHLPDHYNLWRSSYRKRVSGRYGVRMTVEGGTESEIIQEIRQHKKQLQNSLNDWLKSEGNFSDIWTELLKKLKKEDEEIRVIVNCNNSQLQRLPLCIWKQFFKHYHRAEVGLYLPVTVTQSIQKREQVSILAVFGKQESIGNQTKIRTDKDWQILKKFLAEESNVKLHRLDEPSLEELCNTIDRQRPQIFFFAGHSRSKEDEAIGIIELNQEETITIEDFEIELTKAVKSGLQLAIFNSCDGVGIAQQLSYLGIPHIIVMREPVNDEVAQKFLQRFLEGFAAGKSLNLAVRRAREKLKRLDRKFPGAMWIPMLWQNPAELSLTWENLGGKLTGKQYSVGNNYVPGSVVETGTQMLWLPTKFDGNLEPSSLSSNQDIKEDSPQIKQNNELVICPNCNHRNLKASTYCAMCGTLLNKQELEGQFTPDTSTPNTEHKNEQKQEKEESKLELASYSSRANEELLIGVTLRKRYYIVKSLSRGAFSLTYLAEDLDLPGNPLCVVKQLEIRSTDEQFLAISRRLFETEARVLQKLGEHEQIPTLFAYFEENQEFFLIQEFIDGHNLSQEISSGKKLSESYVKNLFKQVLEPLNFIHKNNVIHRDLKPENLIRRKSDGKIFLIDFGAVKRISTNVLIEGQSKSSIVIGTPGYMPMEQLNGQPNFCSDIYALGVIAIQALLGVNVGELPKNSNSQIIWQDQVKVSPKLANFLYKMVSPMPENRYQSAAQALVSLQNLDKSRQDTINSTFFSKAGSYSKISKKYIIIFVLFILFLIMGIILIRISLETEPDKQEKQVPEQTIPKLLDYPN